MKTFAVSLLLALLGGILSSCQVVPPAPKIPDKTGFLTQKTTRQLVTHWAGQGYPAQVAGRPIRLLDQHLAVEPVAEFTPAEEFSKDDKSKSKLGTVVMLHEQEIPAPRQVTEHAWEIASQPATLVARSEADGSLTVTALDFRESASYRGLPLASNYRLPFDYLEEQEDNLLARFFAMIDPAGWSDRRGFYLATEYDPEKIPLIFVHGLLSTPLDFEELASTIASKPDLWRRYQLWYYFYPTGDPWVITGAHFREDFRNLANKLDPQRNHRPLRQETTLIAHSMGGLISRLSVSKRSELLYQQYFNRPLEDIRLLPYQKKRLREQLLFDPLSEPSKIIFLATPHKGSGLAKGPLYWLAQKLVRAPARILGTTLTTAQHLAFAEPGLLTQHGSALISGNELSVTGLRSDSAALKALNQMPVRREVELHNIVATITGGERGLGDWVVPYDSASFGEADSETIVRSGHWLLRDPETAEVVIRLLRE